MPPSPAAPRIAPTPSASLLARLPWLTDANDWRLDWDGDPLPPHRSGVWPIGNGRVFAHAGLALPFNRLQGITGPTYQTEGDRRVQGAFDACWLEVSRAGAPLDAVGHRIWRPRRSGVLVTQTLFPGLTLTSVDFAPPDTTSLVRCIELWGPADDVTLTVRFPAGAPAGPRLVARYRDARAELRLLDATPTAAPGALRVTLRARDAVARITAQLDAGSPHADAPPDALLARTRDAWRAWLTARAPGAVDEVLPSAGPPARRSLTDLLEATAIALRTQQAASGGVAPMVHFKGAWTRDNNGPVRALLALGALEEVAALLRYHHDAALALGELPNRAPVDLDVSHARPPRDWDAFPVPAAEVPSWFVLQHRWWLAAGGDGDLVRRHWPLLERCVRGQRVSPAGLLPFHGDETYLHGALLAVAGERCAPPHDLIAHRPGDPGPPYSLEATAAYAAAGEALAWMAERLGLPRGPAYGRAAAGARAALEAAFWLPDAGHYAPALYPHAPHPVPVAPVNLSLIWMGYARPDDARARGDLDAVVRLVGWNGATPRCPYDVGMTCGYLLRNLAATGSPLAPRALAEVVRRASPAGEWAEIYGPGGRLDAGYDRAYPNRLRPWEGGINAEAILAYAGPGRR